MELIKAIMMDQKHWLAVPLDGSVSDSKVLDLLDMSYDLVDGQAEADGETRGDRQTGADVQATDSTIEEKIDNSNPTFHNDDSGSRELTGKMGEIT